MNRTTRETLISLAAALAFALAAGAAQEPALSGLAPEPTPASATSLTPVPTPATPTLSGGKPRTSGTGPSLADAVKLSKEARKDQPPRKSLGTITNENLKKGGSPTPTPKPGAGKNPPAKTSKKESPPAVPSPSAPDVTRDDKGRSEDDWRSLVGRSKAAVQNGELVVHELETNAKQLENDFYAMSDGNRRDAVVKPAWDKAREDLAKARQQLEDARRALDDLSEEARKSNAPPGWLR
ncbi:MAG: hypothetical protein ACHQM4_08865 [Thermoanaerobaculia bacterium]